MDGTRPLDGGSALFPIAGCVRCVRACSSAGGCGTFCFLSLSFSFFCLLLCSIVATSLESIVVPLVYFYAHYSFTTTQTPLLSTSHTTRC